MIFLIKYKENLFEDSFVEFELVSDENYKLIVETVDKELYEIEFK